MNQQRLRICTYQYFFRTLLVRGFNSITGIMSICAAVGEIQGTRREWGGKGFGVGARGLGYGAERVSYWGVLCHAEIAATSSWHVRISSSTMAQDIEDKPSRTITLFCWILDVSTCSFSITIDDAQTVDDLKEAILKKKSKTLANIEADQLTLWKVSPFIFVQIILISHPQEIHRYLYRSYSEDCSSQPTIRKRRRVVRGTTLAEHLYPS